MKKSGPFSQFADILCVSLRRNKERREHIEKEFSRVGIRGHQYIDAYDKSSKEVNSVYHSDFVAKFPPCFRCGKDNCNCSNKSLIRPQIGNWLSHIKAWRSVQADTPHLTLICEDDVKFMAGIHDALHLIAVSDHINYCLNHQEPVLVRLGWALCADHESKAQPHLTQQIKMANPCYAINTSMSIRLLDSLEEINTTSDIYVHKNIGADINHYTVMPPQAYELSWSTGELHSEIRPKSKRVEHLQQQLGKLEPEDPEYQRIESLRKQEMKRLNQYEKLNNSPTTDYKNKFDLI